MTFAEPANEQEDDIERVPQRRDFAELAVGRGPSAFGPVC
jgi:hypothetical protein